jgi:hypothetical protein
MSRIVTLILIHHRHKRMGVISRIELTVACTPMYTSTHRLVSKFSLNIAIEHLLSRIHKASISILGPQTSLVADDFMVILIWS